MECIYLFFSFFVKLHIYLNELKEYVLMSAKYNILLTFRSETNNNHKLCSSPPAISSTDDSWWLLKQNPKLASVGCEMPATEMRFHSDLRRHQMSQSTQSRPLSYLHSKDINNWCRSKTLARRNSPCIWRPTPTPPNLPTPLKTWHAYLVATTNLITHVQKRRPLQKSGGVCGSPPTLKSIP